jgi:hypothetical protein
MKFKGTAALAVVFIGIVLYYFLIDLPSEKREKEEKNRLEKVILFDSENVKAITFCINRCGYLPFVCAKAF